MFGSFSGKRFLVTGGVGFIGSHLVDALAASDARVVVLDDLSTGKKDNLTRALGSGSVRLVEGSVLDEDLVGELTAEVDGVFHLAGVVGVELVLSDPVAAISSIVEGSRSILRHATEMKRPLFLASTSEVYGPASDTPLRESDHLVLGGPDAHRWSYAVAKLTAEHLSLGQHRQLGLPVTVVRLFNTVGPRQSADHGMVLARFVERALAGEPLLVHGDGSQTRAFCDVRDAVDIILRLASCEAAVGRVVNVGSSPAVTIGELAERVLRVLDSSVGIKRVPYEQAYGPGFEPVVSRVPDLTLLEQLIGGTPPRDLDDTIRTIADTVRAE